MVYHFNNVGSTVAVTDEKGAIKHTYSYTPYGELINGKYGEVDYLYNGQYGVTSDANGLYYMRARYYNIDIKRFINQDILTGNIDSSKSLNRYAYVEGNPISYLDPFGLEPWDTSFIHECLEFAINFFSTLSAINIVAAIFFPQIALITFNAAVAINALFEACSFVNALVYAFDVAHGNDKKAIGKSIVNVINGFISLLGPIGLFTPRNFRVSQDVKSATDWLVGFISDTIGKIATY